MVTMFHDRFFLISGKKHLKALKRPYVSLMLQFWMCKTICKTTIYPQHCSFVKLQFFFRTIFNYLQPPWFFHLFPGSIHGFPRFFLVISRTKWWKPWPSWSVKDCPATNSWSSWRRSAPRMAGGGFSRIFPGGWGIFHDGYPLVN